MTGQFISSYQAGFTFGFLSARLSSPRFPQSCKHQWPYVIVTGWRNFNKLTSNWANSLLSTLALWISPLFFFFKYTTLARFWGERASCNPPFCFSIVVLLNRFWCTSYEITYAMISNVHDTKMPIFKHANEF